MDILIVFSTFKLKVGKWILLASANNFRGSPFSKFSVIRFDLKLGANNAFSMNCK